MNPWVPVYEIYMNFDLLEIVPKGGSQRRAIINFIAGLGRQPFTPGDYTEPDAKGRECQAKIVGGYTVVYWPDHAVQMVMVNAIQEADRGRLP